MMKTVSSRLIISIARSDHFFIRPKIWDYSDDEHARALEEQWIDSLDNTGSSISPSSSATSIMQGLLIGFFFPLLPFFFLREMQPAVFWGGGQESERPRNHVFS